MTYMTKKTKNKNKKQNGNASLHISLAVERSTKNYIFIIMQLRNFY